LVKFNGVDASQRGRKERRKGEAREERVERREEREGGEREEVEGGVPWSNSTALMQAKQSSMTGKVNF
jgi:hypothetical protein